MLEHHRVSPGVPCLLLDERLDRLLELLVVNERPRLVDHLHEPPLPRWQKQVQHVDHVSGERIVGNPVLGGVGPVEARSTGLGRMSLLRSVYFRILDRCADTRGGLGGRHPHHLVYVGVQVSLRRGWRLGSA
jgi:hypothetical protein